MNLSNKQLGDLVVIGKIGSPYGIKGWLKIYSYTQSAADILQYQPWYVEQVDSWNEVKISAGKPHGKGVIAKLPGCATPEQARLFSGKTIAVKRSQLPVLSKNEFYWNDLLNLEVINQDNKSLGKVSYLIETGSNDVLVVKGQAEVAIPFRLGDVIKEVDLVNKKLFVEWDFE